MLARSNHIPVGYLVVVTPRQLHRRNTPYVYCAVVHPQGAGVPICRVRVPRDGLTVVPHERCADLLALWRSCGILTGRMEAGYHRKD